MVLKALLQIGGMTIPGHICSKQRGVKETEQV